MEECSMTNERHNMSHHRLYRIWNKIKQRCYNKNDTNFKWYGAKGVEMDSDWKKSFESFMKWSFANGYQDDLTIDRIDSAKGYEPSNCRWITREENTRRASIGRSKRTGELYEFNGEKKSLREWSEELGVGYITLYNRIKSGWTIDMALSTKVGTVTNSELLSFNGKTQTLTEWAEELNIKSDTLWQRIYRLNWSVEKALTTKTRKRQTK